MQNELAVKGCERVVKEVASAKAQVRRGVRRCGGGRLGLHASLRRRCPFSSSPSVMHDSAVHPREPWREPRAHAASHCHGDARATSLPPWRQARLAQPIRGLPSPHFISMFVTSFRAIR